MVVAIVLTGCGKGGGGGDGFDDKAQAAFTATLARADEQTAALERARLDGITRAATAELAAGEPCPPGISLMRDAQIDNFVRLVAPDVPKPTTARALADTKGLRATAYERRSRTARDLLDRRVNKTGLDELLTELGSPTFWAPYELAFVVTRVDPPKVPEPGPYATFYPGTLTGRVIVWSYAKSAVACWAPVSVASHDTEEVIMGDTNADKNETLLYTLYSDADTAAIKAIGADGRPGDLLDRAYY